MGEAREHEGDLDHVHIVLLRILSDDPDPRGVVRRVVEAIGRGTYADLLDSATARCEDTGQVHELAEPAVVEQRAHEALLERRGKQIEEIRSSVVQLLQVPGEPEIPGGGARLRTGLVGDAESESTPSATGEGLGPDGGDWTGDAAGRCSAVDRKRYVTPLLDLCPGLMASDSYPEITQMGVQIASELRLSGTAVGDLAVILMRTGRWTGRYGRGFEAETLGLLTAISRLDHAIHVRRNALKNINPSGSSG